MRIKITTRKALLVRQGLEDLSAEIPKIGRQRLYGTATRVVDRMKVYPPKRAGQKYVRMFRFQKSWSIRSVKEGLGYAISTSMKAAKYVVGNASGKLQAWMHVDRWILFYDTVMEEVEKMKKSIREALLVSGKRNKK